MPPPLPAPGARAASVKMARAAERGGARLGLLRLRLLVPLLVVPAPAAAARPPASFPSDVNGHSLHPPYFNLAEGTRISATATCGEEAAGGGSRRAVEDLYCKLVGGPVAGGDPNQTIQVRPAGWGSGTDAGSLRSFAGGGQSRLPAGGAERSEPALCCCPGRRSVSAVGARRGRARCRWEDGGWQRLQRSGGQLGGAGEGASGGQGFPFAVSPRIATCLDLLLSWCVSGAVLWGGVKGRRSFPQRILPCPGLNTRAGSPSEAPGKSGAMRAIHVLLLQPCQKMHMGNVACWASKLFMLTKTCS